MRKTSRIIALARETWKLIMWKLGSTALDVAIQPLHEVLLQRRRSVELSINSHNVFIRMFTTLDEGCHAWEVNSNTRD